MKTLYDLLGALPHDDAEGLRAAFRSAVKGAHPDIRSGDPDAALKFREIVRANEILGDPEQRQAYDHLLELARQEQEPAPAHKSAVRIHRIASSVLALSGAAVVIVGGYLLFMSISSTSAVLANAASLPGPEILTCHDGDANGDANNSLAAFDRPMELHPKALPAYVDPDFDRHARFDGAFPDIAPASANRPRSAPTVTRKQPRHDQPAVAHAAMPPARQMTVREFFRQQAVAQMR